MLAVSEVSPLRKKMIEDMQLHGLSENTQELYARAVSQLSQYVHRGPDKVTEEDIRQYFLYLAKREEVCTLNHHCGAMRNKVFLRKHTPPGLADDASGASGSGAQVTRDIKSG